VQQDIFVKMDARVKKKKEAEAASERSRMSAWLAAYHKNREEIIAAARLQAQQQKKD